eukprot:1157540-Pelagomonas_calceolata.AAC.23
MLAKCLQIRNMMSMALCLADGGGTKAADTTEAGKILQRAYDLAAQNKLSGIQKEVAMLQVGRQWCLVQAWLLQGHVLEWMSYQHGQASHEHACMSDAAGTCIFHPR